MGQPNMLGFGHVAGDKNGTLQNATKNSLYPYLVDEAGAWTARKDVRNVRVMNFKDSPNDWMSPSNPKNIGTEMGIGYALGAVNRGSIFGSENRTNS
jgi:hypothetical protein